MEENFISIDCELTQREQKLFLRTKVTELLDEYLVKKGYLKINLKFYINSTKIVFSTLIMYCIFLGSLNYFAKNLTYLSDYKTLYLLIIVFFVALLYFLICYFLKLLNVKSFNTN